MAKAFCIPRDKINAVKKVIKDLGMKKFYSLGSPERKALFSDILGADGAKEFNLSFEKAASVDALARWAKDIGEGKKIPTTAYEALKKKLSAIKKLNLYDEKNASQIFEDLAMDKLGVSVTDEQIRFITAKADKMDSLLQIKDAAGNVTGLKTLSPVGKNYEHTLAYMKEMADLERYMKELAPSSRVEVALSTIGRGNMIAAIKSSLVNFTNNLINTVADRVSLRLTYGGGSKAAQAMKKEWITNARKIYSETGIDISRMIDITQFERKSLGETVVHSEGKGVTRAIGRFYEDKIFNPFLSSAKTGGDNLFSTSMHGNSVFIRATAMARDMGLRGKDLEKKAMEIMEDAFSLTPQNMNEGGMVRLAAIADATKTTLTDERMLSKLGLEMRNAVDAAGKGMNLPLGTALAPFVKTPANAVQRNLDASGLGFISAALDIRKAMKAGETGKGVYRDAARKIIETGGFISGAGFLSTFISADDFMGSFDPRRQKIDQLKNVTYNAININGHWISLDYFGPLAAPLTGFLYAKKYGTSWSDKFYMYGKGTALQFYRFPLIGMYEDSINAITKAKDPNQSAGKAFSGVADTVTDFLLARIVPATVSDIAKAMDTYERKAKTIGENIMMKIPVLRSELEPARNILGEPRKLEAWWSTMLFGARVRTQARNEIIDEISRLDGTDNMPSITDFRNSSSVRIKQIQEKMTKEEFATAADAYDKAAKENILTVIQDASYADMLDEDKKAEINHAVERALSDVLDEYGYERPESSRRKYIVK